LLAGLARQIRNDLQVPVACMLEGEDTFLDALPEATRAAAWAALAERSNDIDMFITPSHYFGGLMGVRLNLGADRLRVVPNGINLEGFSPASEPPEPPVLGYFARMCPEKGLGTLVDAYLLLRRRDRLKNLKLRVGGGCGPSDEPYVASLRERIKAQGALHDVEFRPNLDRAAKLEFYRSLSVFSVPALYGEAFGLYLLEAMASGVPVVQPRHAAFPELIEAAGGGILCEPGDPKALADALETVLTNRILASGLGDAGRKAVREKYGVERMARDVMAVFEEVLATD
jgi:glycosyltransferase involved in cell wall biosynthesis